MDQMNPRWRLLRVAVPLALALSACGGSDKAATTPPATTAKPAATTSATPTSTTSTTTTVKPTTTTAAPTTTARPTTTVKPGLSREARVAVQKCVDAVGIPTNLPAMAIISGPQEIQDAMALCGDAKTQVEVDGDAQLTDDLASLVLSLASLNTSAVTGDLEPDGSGAARPAVTAFTGRVAYLLSSIDNDMK